MAFQGTTRHYKALKGTTRHYKALQGIPRHSKAFQGVTRHYKALQGTTRHYKAFQGITRHSKALHISSRCEFIVWIYIYIYSLDSKAYYLLPVPTMRNCMPASSVSMKNSAQNGAFIHSSDIVTIVPKHNTTASSKHGWLSSILTSASSTSNNDESEQTMERQ